MPIKLTSTGIEYSNGTVQTKNTSLIKLYSVTGANPGASTYEWTSIPSDAKRIRLVLHSATLSATGPSTGTLVPYTDNGATIATSAGGYVYLGSIHRWTSNSDMLHYSQYHNIPLSGGIVDIYTISTGTTSHYMYNTIYGGRFGATCGRFSGSGTLSKLVWNAGSTISNFTAALYYEK